MSEAWEAIGKNVFCGKDCIGIFATDNASDAVMEKRARLAAAAPELLVRLKDVLEYAWRYADLGDDGYSDAHSSVELAQALIAKAEGRTP